MKSNGKKVKERIEWIDYAKAIGMFLVVWGHAISEYNLNTKNVQIIIYSMHMPLFFYLSGLVFKIKNNLTFKSFFLKKIKTLIIPYIIFSGLIIFFHILEVVILKGKFEFFRYLLSRDGIINTILFTDKSAFSNLWFIPCLLSSECIIFFLEKYIKNKKIAFGCLIILGIIALKVKELYAISLPLNMETACVACLFIYIGCSMRNKMDRLLNNNILGIAMICIFLLANYIYIKILNIGYCQSFYNLRLHNPYIFGITAISGFFALSFLCKKIRKNKALQMVGMQSIYIYGIHYLIQNIIGICFSILKIEPRNIPLIGIVCSILNIMLCMFIINLFYMLKEKWRKNENCNCKNVCR